jgi:hypothetical protein
METPDTGEAGCGYARATDALTRRRLACLALLGVPVAGVGFCASFAGVSAMFEPWRWAWAVPVTVDVTILTCTLALLFGAEVGHRWAPVRPVLYGLITTTVYLNWATATTLAERVGHAAAPAVYAFLVEMLVSWERFRRRLTGPARDGVPFGVWLTAPRFAWAVQRTIWRTGAPGYAHAEAVLRARRELAGRWRQRHGRRWRTAIDPADRVRYEHYAVHADAVRLDAPAAERERVSLRPNAPQTHPPAAPAAEPDTVAPIKRDGHEPGPDPDARADAAGSVLGESLEAEAAALITRLGRVPSLRTMQRELGVGRPKAAAVLAHLAVEPNAPSVPGAPLLNAPPDAASAVEQSRAGPQRNGHRGVRVVSPSPAPVSRNDQNGGHRS